MPLHSVGFTTQGLTEFSAALRKVDAEAAKNLRKSFKAIADHVVDVARGRMEFGGGGEAGKSVRPRATQKGAAIAFPKGGTPWRGVKADYYPWLDFGGGKPGVRGITSSTGPSHKKAPKSQGGFKRHVIIGGRYIYPAVFQSRQYISDEVDVAMEKAIKSQGFDTRGHV